MAIEIERKFLVDHNKWQATAKPTGTHYKQGYIINIERGAARVRVAGERAYITFKGAGSGISRSEFEYAIPVNEAIELLKLFARSSVEKIRYNIEFDGKLWEVDVFLGDNEGLIVAEIELQSEEEAFTRPDWLAEEVSHEDRYFNSNLSTHPYKTW